MVKKEENISVEKDVKDNDKEKESTPAEEAKESSGWDAPAEEAKESSGWDVPAEEAKESSGWDAPAEEAKESSGWDVPAEEAKESSGWGSNPTTSTWDAPSVPVEDNAPARDNSDYKNRSYEQSGRDEYPRKRFDRGDGDRHNSSYGQDKRFRDNGDRRSNFAPRDREGGYESRNRDYESRGRSYESRGRDYESRDREGGYRGRDRESNYEPREGGYRSRDREGYGSRDREGYGSRDREGYGSRDREGYGSRGRDYESRSRDYESRSRDYESRGRDYESRGRDYESRGREGGYRSNDQGYERSSNRGRFDRDSPSTYDPMAENNQKSYESRPKKVIPENVPPSKTLGLFGLSLYATEEDLREFLNEELADIKDYKLTIITDYETKKSRGFGFVYFQCLEDSIKAKESLRGKSIKGKEIRVDYSLSDALRPNYR